MGAEEAALVGFGHLFVSHLREEGKERNNQSVVCLVRIVRLELALLFIATGTVELGGGPVGNVNFVIAKLDRGNLADRMLSPGGERHWGLKPVVYCVGSIVPTRRAKIDKKYNFVW
eukprot:4026830-Ditylum_brightwellii.AAC.1